MKKPLIALILFAGLVVTGCSQSGGPAAAGVATARLAGPEVVEATFTPLPPISSPTPTATSTEAAAPSATPEITATPTEEIIPSATPSAEPLPAESSGNGEACTDKAAYYADVTIPDGTSFQQSVGFTKTWQISNEGTCMWNGYKLVYAGGDIMDGAPSNPMAVIQPGEIANVSVDLKSPPQGGEYTGMWELENAAGKRFGFNSHGKDLIWVKIGVSWFTAENPPGNPKPTPGGKDTAPDTSCAIQQNTDYEAQIMTLINQARADNRLAALTLQAPLTAAARGHSKDMACNDFIDHTGSDGSSWYNRIQAQKYSYSYASENIYVGDPDFGGDAQGAFTWWMNSDVHRANILNPKVTSIGIGYAYYAGSTYKGYYTVDFTRP